MNESCQELTFIQRNEGTYSKLRFLGPAVASFHLYGSPVGCHWHVTEGDTEASGGARTRTQVLQLHSRLLALYHTAQAGGTQVALPGSQGRALPTTPTSK